MPLISYPTSFISLVRSKTFETFEATVLKYFKFIALADWSDYLLLITSLLAQFVVAMLSALWFVSSIPT